MARSLEHGLNPFKESGLFHENLHRPQQFHRRVRLNPFKESGLFHDHGKQLQAGYDRSQSLQGIRSFSLEAPDFEPTFKCGRLNPFKESGLFHAVRRAEI